MKAEATVIWVNDKPLEFDNGKKCYETKFCDDDGLTGTVYIMDKKPIISSKINVLLDQDKSEKLKFKLNK